MVYINRTLTEIVQSPGRDFKQRADAGTTQENAYSLPGSPDLRQLEHPSFGSWLNYRASLRPHYRVVWFEIILCISMMLGGFAAHLWLVVRWGNLTGLAAALPGALWIGFWLNALLTFGHEAAHYNLSANRKRNDFLADWSIWLFFPQTTKAYRKSHWQHHLHLGDSGDTEISYHNCLSPWFLIKTLSGIYLTTLVFRYVFKRRTTEQNLSVVPREMQSRISIEAIVAPLRAFTIHGAIVGIALYLHCYASAVTWIAGVGFVFPFLATIRQILEHRSADAHCATDFETVPHGAINRTFGNNLFSRFYGAAGFNRHLLHHWDPTVSYTCFDEMEAFFRATPLRERLESSRSDYLSCLILLFRKALRDRT
jgi:fatty acid desaturase